MSPRSEERLRAAEVFLGEGNADAVALLVGPSRGAALDLAARVGSSRGAIFGLHRLTLGQLAARLAAPELARRRLAPATPLGVEAVVARAVASALEAGALGYFAPVARTPSFASTLAATLSELRVEGVGPAEIRGDDPRRRDLRELARRYDEQRERARIADRAEVLAAAMVAVREASEIRRARLVLLDVPIASRLEEKFVAELVAAADVTFATAPTGDDRAVEVLAALASEVVTDRSERSHSSLSRLHQYLFAAAELPAVEAGEDVSFFSAPGEGRECVEITRRILAEARRGVPFDDIAVFLRAPDTYAALLESALRRAKIPAHFAIGAARPDPSGRAFLALLACRAEDLSPRRFAEYLSLAPMPKENVAAAPQPLMPRADLFGALLEGETSAKRMRREQASEGARVPARSVPIGWERLLTKASIVGRKERWAERLAALEKAFERELALLRRRDPSSPRIETVEREIEVLSELTRFALPLVEALASLPDLGSWGVWIEELGKLARMALEEPEDVLSALFELAPMAELPAVSFDEVRRVLEGRLGSRVTPPSGRRYGAVFVGTPELARGRSFAVVFVPGLAERLFPEAPREDPILLDGDRRVISKALRTQADRSRNERLLLRLSVGAARERVHLSYPRVEVVAGRPRVPSFYGLDVRRATTGTLPDHDALERDAASASGARLAWPAPAQPEDAIDDAEHDLAMLGRLLHGGEEAEAAGRAQYLLDLNPHLARSLRARSARW
ncbi:MAG TPA: PD-(D/E)XK nuclease family protein, partial [Polyangium sp.]|nr:PD-(D/E)XK nuclease family protein [Polyangium sp.]